MKIKTLTNPTILKRFPKPVRSKASNPDPGSRKTNKELAAFQKRYNAL